MITRTMCRIALGLIIGALAAPELAATQRQASQSQVTINSVTCDRGSCRQPLELVNGRSVTIGLTGRGLDVLVSGVVTDKSGRRIQGVTVELTSLGRPTRRRNATMTRDATVTAQRAAALTGLELRFTTSARGSVTAPLDLSISPMPTAPGNVVAGPVAVADRPLPQPGSETLTTLEESLPPRFTSASPAMTVLGPRESASVELAGSNLDMITEAHVRDADDGQAGMGRLVYHVRAELEPGSETRRTVRLTVPDGPNQRGPFGTPMTVWVRAGESGTLMPTPARVEVPPMYDLLISSCRIEPVSSQSGRYTATVAVQNHSINTIAASIPAGAVLVAGPPGLSIPVPAGGLYLAPGQGWSHETNMDLSSSSLSLRLLPGPGERSHANNERTCRVPPHPAPPAPGGLAPVRGLCRARLKR